MYAVSKLNSKELHLIQNIKNKSKPTSQLYYEPVFKKNGLEKYVHNAHRCSY